MQGTVMRSAAPGLCSQAVGAEVTYPAFSNVWDMLDSMPPVGWGVCERGEGGEVRVGEVRVGEVRV